MENTDLIVDKKNENVAAEPMHAEHAHCECSDESCKRDEKVKSIEESIDPKKEKIVPVTEISDELKSSLKESVYTLLILKEEVNFRKKFIVDKVATIRDKASKLAETYKFKLDPKEHERAEKSVNQYAGLLDGIAKEVERELVLNYMMLNEGEKKLEKLVAPIDSSDSFAVHVAERIKWTKKFVKDLNKNLSVSYSRYLFGFEDQERQLDVLEANLKYHAANK